MSRYAYERSLPAAGFVAITVSRTGSMRHGRMFKGIVVVERRSEDRRTGHRPPVVATAWGNSADVVIRQLLPIAQCNHALGEALIQLKLA
jgi:hypothetical protein